MRKPLFILGAAVLFASQAFASYWVVLRDGTKYEVKQKPAVVNGKAVLNLVNGTTFQVDPNQIDPVKSEETTRLGGGKLIATEIAAPAAPKQETSSLGAAIKLRKQQQAAAAPVQAAPANANPAPPPVASSSGAVGIDVLQKFERAYENVGIFEHNLVSTGAHSIRAELTADSEEKVFNAISATSYLMVRNAGVTGAQIDMIELFMKTISGGSSGRFQMSRADATALDTKAISKEEYYVRKVIY